MNQPAEISIKNNLPSFPALKKWLEKCGFEHDFHIETVLDEIKLEDGIALNPAIILSLANAPKKPQHIQQYLKFAMEKASGEKIPIILTGHLYRHSFAGYNKCSMVKALSFAQKMQDLCLKDLSKGLSTLTEEEAERFSIHNWQEVVTYDYFQKVKLFRSLYREEESKFRQFVDQISITTYQKRTKTNKLPSERKLAYQVNFFLEEFASAFFGVNLKVNGKTQQSNVIIHPAVTKHIEEDKIFRSAKKYYLMEKECPLEPSTAVLNLNFQS